MTTHKFLIEVEVPDDHQDADDAEWWADAATGALSDYGAESATFYLDQQEIPGSPLIAFVREVAALAKDGEGDQEMENDFAYDALHEFISEARALLTPDVPVTSANRDAMVLDRLNLLLSAPEWPGASGMEDVAEIVRSSGRKEVPNAPEWGRH